MTATTIQAIALWPAELIVRLVLMLFGVELEYLPHHWRVITVGCVACKFWGHLIKGIIILAKRHVFGLYGGVGQ